MEFTNGADFARYMLTKMTNILTMGTSLLEELDRREKMRQNRTQERHTGN